MCAEITLKIVHIPSHEQSYSNRALVNSKVFADSSNEFSNVKVISNNNCTVFTIQIDDNIQVDCIGLNALFRDNERLSCNSFVIVKPYEFQANENIQSISFNVELLGHYNNIESFNAKDIVDHLRERYLKFAFKVDRKIVIKLNRKKTLILTVRVIEFIDVDRRTTIGYLDESSKINFSDDSCSVNLLNAEVCSIPESLITNPNWNYKKIGVGGLSKEINKIIRRTFYTRMLPVTLIDQLKIKHTKGILLYGPPGTGKTLLAREIGKMLNARNIHIISGPQLLNKYVGESEANVRKLFDNAEKEFHEKGNYSQLHVIVIDEIDAICKQRGEAVSSSTGSGSGSGVSDNIVNQFLSKIDGMVHVNNILIIGMTNRRQTIDDALLRPGRLEVQIEITLPDEEGRLEIFEIHTNLLFENDKISSDVDLEELAKKTQNFSGAEIEGLVRAAITLAIKRATDENRDRRDIRRFVESFKVNNEDFVYALNNDIIKTKQQQNSKRLRNEVKLNDKLLIHWSSETQNILDELRVLVDHAIESNTITSVLIEGESGSGKTTIANIVASDCRYQFVADILQMQQIEKIFQEAYRFKHSCVIIDDIDRMTISSNTLPLRYDFLKRDPPENCRLLIICTANVGQKILDHHDFSLVVKLPAINNSDQLQRFLRNCEHNCFNSNEIGDLASRIKNVKFQIGCKRANKLLQITKLIEPGKRIDYFLKKALL